MGLYIIHLLIKFLPKSDSKNERVLELAGIAAGNVLGIINNLGV